MLNAPIVEAMKKYSIDGAVAFHTPGHKQGLGAHKLLRDLITNEGLRQEVSLMEELDDLHAPRGIIAQSQALAAKLWHADETIFFVNGTTAAVQAMILSTVGDGDTILIPRNAHRCVTNALILSGAKPVFLPPDFDTNFEIALNVSIETVKQTVEKYPHARALVITSPNYYGVAADLKSIAEIVHRHGMLLLVDEAHGAHLQFSDELPPSAPDSGADMSAQSTHKLLGSLTQTSMLMINSARVDVERVRRVASMLQSTSPNYLLLASLDIARLQMETDGVRLISSAIELSRRLRQTVKSIDGLRLFEAPRLDVTKVTVNVRGLSLTGLEAERILRHELKVQCELSDVSNVLFLITFADTVETIERLESALRRLSMRRGDFENDSVVDCDSLIGEAVISPREAFYAKSVDVPIENAVDCVCAEEITFYPPGIPIICPGEILTQNTVNTIKKNIDRGRRIVGAADKSLRTIKIITHG